jgi:hypothetical protein
MANFPREPFFPSHDSKARSERRNWAHQKLDELLDRREAWEANEPDVRPLGKSYSTQYAAAEALNAEALTFSAFLIGRGAQEAICPTFASGRPEEMRRALADLLNLVAPVLPKRPKPVGSARTKDCHWVDDLCRDLKMLDYGQVPPIFERKAAKGIGKAEWTETRFRFLGALWAIHLKAQKATKPDHQVAAAFGLAAHGHVTVRSWREQVEAAGQTGAPIWGLDTFLIREAIIIASEPAGEDSVSQIFGKRLSSIAFGTRWNGSASLAEAGRRYHAHKAKIDARQPTTRRKGARSKSTS